MKRHRHSFRILRRGLTLVELVTVLAIVAVLAAMVVPRYGNAINRYRVDAAARRVAADIAFAQSRARALSTSRSIWFDINDGTYLLNSETGFNSASTYSIDLTADPYDCTIGTANFGGTATITFNGYGFPASAGTIQLQSGNATRIVSVDPNSGAATLQ